MNRWGNDDHGPGGDPSWLGGGDRDGAEPQGADGSGGWSSDFASDAQGADPDFGDSRDPQAAERMAPRFGDVTGDEARRRGGESESSWMAGFTGQGTEESSSSRSTLGTVIGGVVPILVVVVFGVIIMRFFDFGLSAWWIFVFVIPFIRRITRKIGKHFGD
ncbi:hypothetical protein CFK38_01480 [Brachybacterium vulturis]|uniref:Uncharacterized protein n=2 Tax=Brachybacterium vulturis TaxID=2017484 RepID=A0A291GJF7_9MICO|nr:hypothetical protein CFK38_01480 [Brachybacterium vulturis]